MCNRLGCFSVRIKQEALAFFELSNLASFFLQKSDFLFYTSSLKISELCIVQLDVHDFCIYVHLLNLF